MDTEDPTRQSLRGSQRLAEPFVPLDSIGDLLILSGKRAEDPESLQEMACVGKMLRQGAPSIRM